MAPKRAAKVVGVALKTTKKVVQKTKVQVAVIQTPQKQEQGKQAKSIPVEQKSPQQQQQQETQTQSTGEDVQKQVPKQASTTSTSSPEEQKPPHEEEEAQTQKTQSDGEEVQKQEAEEKKNGKKKSRPRRGRGRKRRFEGGDQGMGYRRYAYRVLKQVHPGMAISSKAMTIINNLITDMFERLAEEACRLSKYTGRITLSSREIQGAVRLVLPGELGRHAIAEGTKAVTNYMCTNHTGGDPVPCRIT